MDAELKEEEEELERNERIGVYTSQFAWNLTRMHTSVKNNSIYTKFGRNRPIVSIDGYDETVHRGPFWLSRGRRIVMDGHDLMERNAL